MHRQALATQGPTEGLMKGDIRESKSVYRSLVPCAARGTFSAFVHDI